MFTSQTVEEEVVEPKEEVVEVTPEIYTLGEGFVCKACDMTGLNPITKSLCSVCNGTPER